MAESLPLVVADTPLSADIEELLSGKVEIRAWPKAGGNNVEPDVQAIYTFGHPRVDGPFLDRYPSVRVVSNFGVGVDHIDVPAAKTRGIPVGNTPSVLDGATADMAFALLLAAGRRLVEGDRYARSAAFTHYDPGYMLGREIHGATIGIVGLGRIGQQVAARARGFNMKIFYHNRRQLPDDEVRLDARWLPLEELLRQSDYVVLTVPLTDATRGLIGRGELALMQPTATLINVARGPVVDTQALTEALQSRAIYAAAVDVTDPEPLPRDHPLLSLDNFTIAPHLGSATVQTRRRMAEMSVENLMAGLGSKALLWQV